MGLMGRLEWLNSYGKKQCRSLFWRVRAAAKKAVKTGEKRQFKFQYDPSSYALNFDDGFACCPLSRGGNEVKHADTHNESKTTWVWVVWVESK